MVTVQIGQVGLGCDFYKIEGHFCKTSRAMDFHFLAWNAGVRANKQVLINLMYNANFRNSHFSFIVQYVHYELLFFRAPLQRGSLKLAKIVSSQFIIFFNVLLSHFTTFNVGLALPTNSKFTCL